MKYAAYLETNGTSVRVLPRSKKTALFTTLKAAQEKFWRMRLAQDGRGIVYQINAHGEREYVWSIAL